MAGAFFLVGTAQALVYECSPPPGTPLCQFPKKIDVTFIGTAVATNYIPNPPGGGDLASFGMWYRFSVTEALTGLRPGEKEVTAYLSIGGGQPEVGRAYFVHAVREGSGVRLASCGNTRPVEEAAADIQYLRDRANGRFRSYIAGSVLRHYEGSPYGVEGGLGGSLRGEPGAAVTLRNGKVHFELVTDERGQFRVENVAAGKYTLDVQAAGFQAKRAYTVEVPNGGCGVGHVGVFTDAGVSGIVRRADGTPASGIELDMIDSEPGYRSPTQILDRIKTGIDGSFSRRGLPSGRFLLGVSIQECMRYPDQTPPTYYPGAVDRAQAEVITLKPNEKREGLVLTLPPPRAFRSVRVHLRWPDGRIPAGGAITAYVNEGIYDANYELKDGAFELQLLQGVDYWLTAAALDETRKPTPLARGTWVYADNYRLAAGNDPVELTVTAHFAEPQWSKAIYPRASR